MKEREDKKRLKGLIQLDHVTVTVIPKGSIQSFLLLTQDVG
jgi:hypothetical protein